MHKQKERFRRDKISMISRKQKEAASYDTTSLKKIKQTISNYNISNKGMNSVATISADAMHLIMVKDPLPDKLSSNKV